KLKPVTRAMIQIKAKTLSQKSPYITYYPGITESKFSNKWVDGFIICYKLSNRRRTSVAQKLSEDLHEKSCFTIVLTYLADGTKLPPIIIFKLVNVPRQVFPARVYVRTNPKEWMNKVEMLW
ncbi:16580_t:CDS:2, partial [Dentiscutata erythropus]